MDNNTLTSRPRYVYVQRRPTMEKDNRPVPYRCISNNNYNAHL